MKKYEEFSENKVKIPEKLTKKLVSLSEQGMGYQIVNVTLTDGRLLLNRKVLNSEYLLIDKSEDIRTEDISKIECL